MNESTVVSLTTAAGWERFLPLAVGPDLPVPVEVEISEEQGVAVYQEAEAPHDGVRLTLLTELLTADWCEKLTWELGGVPGVVPAEVERDEQGCLLVPPVRPHLVCAEHATWQVTPTIWISHGNADGIWWADETGTVTTGRRDVVLSLAETWQLVRVLTSVLAWQDELDATSNVDAGRQRAALGVALGLWGGVPLFPAGSTASVRAYPVNEDAVEVTLCGDGMLFTGLPAGEWGRARLVVVEPRQRLLEEELWLEDVLAGVLPEHISAGGTREVAPVEPDEVTEDTCVWRITEELSVEQGGRNEVYLRVKGQVRVGDVRTLDLSAEEAWTLVCVLASAGEWRRSLDAAYEALALGRRRASLRAAT